MDDVQLKFCGTCGTKNEGTKFCEVCGAPAPADRPVETAQRAFAPPPPPSQQYVNPGYGYAPQPVFAPRPPRSRGPLYILGFITYCLFITFPYFGGSLLNALRLPSFDVAYYTVLVILAVATSLLVGIAGFVSGPTPGRKITGGLLGITYFILPVVGLFLFPYVFYGLGILSIVLSSLPDLLLFLSWGIARPFRGIGFAALGAGLVLQIVYSLSSNVLFGNLGFGLGSYLVPLLYLIVPLATVGLALLLERSTNPRPPVQQFYPAQ